jgi:3-dehydroquinate dehydratase
VRADALDAVDDDDALRAQVQALRRGLPDDVAVVYTARSPGQGGVGSRGGSEAQSPRAQRPRAGDDARKEYEARVEVGVRLGCELVDVEACWGSDVVARLARRAHEAGAAVVCSWHTHTLPPSKVR